MSNFLKKAAEKLSLMDPVQRKRLITEILEAIDARDSILDSFEDGIILLDSQHRIFYMNASVRRLVSINYKKDWLSKEIGSQIADHDITDFLFDRWNDSRREKSESREFTYQNGESVRIIRITLSSGFTKFKEKSLDLVRITDVTDSKLEENRLRRSESLAQMTTMAAGVAHEIKNPLGSISLYLQLLRREYKKRNVLSADEAEKYLGVIGEEIDRLNAIVVDFLFAVRPLTVNLAKEDLNRLVSELADFAGPELKQNNMKLELKLESGLPRLNIDRSLFRQAALNIVKNSIQAIQARFPSMLSEGRISIETKLRNDWVDVLFSDNGCGIPEDMISKVFEPYYTTKETGTGLGLTVLFKIIKEHNGDINLVSKVNEGTTFILSFPVPKDERLKLGYNGADKIILESEQDGEQQGGQEGVS